MGRRRKNFTGQKAISFAPESSAAIAVETLPENPPQISAENPQEESTQENFPKPQKERLSWPISESGKFDVNGFRKETAEQAKEVARASFLDPEFRKWAGIEQETGPVADAIFPPTIAGQALDLIASVETLAMAKKTGMSYDECHKFMKWDEREHATLDPQGARLARKYVPAKWLENADLVMFVSSIAGLSAMKMRMLQEYAAKRLEEIGKATGKDMGKKIEAPQAATTFGAVAPANGSTAPAVQNPAEGKSLE